MIASMFLLRTRTLRKVDDLLRERGIDISHETVRYWRTGSDRRRPVI